MKRSQYIPTILAGMAFLVIWGCNEGPASGNLPEVVDFNFHIRPILSDRCFACHGPDENKREAHLRLDTPEGALSTELEDGGFAFVAGNPDQSIAFQRLITHDREYLMPPPESNLSVSEHETELIRKWIEQGADYKPHWAFIPPQKTSLPNTNIEKWQNNPIDRFVGKKLRTEGIEPSPSAERETLIRRASFDITGLPPAVEEIDAFLQDDSPKAYEKLLDRLLQSPHYGERMAAHWLEVARFADSDGYLDDKHRDFSPWRDWVIEAFNKNLPYDDFLTWQLAGDLLDQATEEQILATAFNRLHKKNSEAGIVFEEFRAEYVADRTNTVGKAFLGLTMECARCHDHKYDPVSQKEYYQLYGFFNQTDELGTAVYGPDQTPGPALVLTDEESRRQIEFLKEKIAQSESRLKHQQEDHQKPESPTFRGITQSVAASTVAWYSFDRLQSTGENNATAANHLDHNKPATISGPVSSTGYKGNAVFVSEYNAITLGDKVGWFEKTEPFSLSFAAYPDTLYEEAGLFYHCEDLRLGLKGYSAHLEDNHIRFIIAHSWPHNAIEVKTVKPLEIREWTHLFFTYNGSGKAEGIHIYFDGQEVETEIIRDNLYKGILFEWNIHTYGFRSLFFGHRTHHRLFRDGGIDEVKVYTRNLSPLEVLSEYQPETAKAILATPETPENKKIIQDHIQLKSLANEKQLYADMQQWRDSLNKTMNQLPEIMVMGDLPSDEARSTFILNRGEYRSPGEEVEPGTPEAILAFDKKLPVNRLGLAKWLTHPENPLTARVFVNRIWQLHFGRGLVQTSDDFGAQGDLPSHPELLDWLAVWFMESGWDIKALHHLILSSQTYRQSSVATSEIIEKDPDNVLLARGPSFRLPAEMIRDNALAVSGLLVSRIGGPSVYPYQPEGLWSSITNKKWQYVYQQEPGEGLYRRSIYTIWKRTSAPPSLLIFDAGDRDVCTVRRRQTNTPLQALVLLNDPQHIEAARVLAEKTMASTSEDEAIGQTFRKITGRKADETEIRVLNDLYQHEYQRFTNQPDSLKAYLSVGELSSDTTLNQTSLAALASVVHAIMNTTDAYTKR